MLAKVAAALFVADLVIIMLGSVAPAVAHNVYLYSKPINY
jgi:hypothetical protein